MHPCMSIEEVRSLIEELHQGDKTRRRFPKEVWESIIQLTQTQSVEEVCKYLPIQPAYLRRKISQLRTEPLEFREVTPQHPPGEVVIELQGYGVSAKILGPMGCLDYLCRLMGR